MYTREWWYNYSSLPRLHLIIRTRFLNHFVKHCSNNKIKKLFLVLKIVFFSLKFLQCDLFHSLTDPNKYDESNVQSLTWKYCPLSNIICPFLTHNKQQERNNLKSIMIAAFSVIANLIYVKSLAKFK